MANGLLDLLGGALGTTPPSYMEGLLGQQATDDLRKRSIGTGIVNALVGYAAMPKNQNLGLGRILAGTAQAGMQGAQSVYDDATQDYMTQQKIAEVKRKQEQQAALQGMIGNIQDPNERLLAQLSPEKYAELRLKTPDSPFAKIDPKDYTPESIAQYSQSKDPSVLRKAVTDAEADKLTNLINIRDSLIAENPNNPNIAAYQGAIDKLTKFAPTASTTVNIADKTFDTEFAKGVGASVQSTYDKAAAAQTTLQKIQQLRPVIKAGVYSGPLSGAQTTLAQIADKLGTSGKNTTDTLNRTAEAMQGLASFELDAAAAMRGQGAITENERMLIQRAAAGRLDQFTSPQIQTLLNTLEKTSRFRIQAHNKNLGRLKNMPNVSQYADFYTLPNMPKEVNY